MDNKIQNNVGELSKKANLSEALEKLGALAVKMQEEEARMQKIAQSFIPSNDKLSIDHTVISQAIADYKPEPIVPNGYFERTQEYQQKSLEMLQSINENTANLYTIVELINQNNDKQEELMGLIVEILSLAKAKNKEEADSLFKSIMEKIHITVESVDSMIKVAGWATSVYKMVLPLLA